MQSLFEASLSGSFVSSGASLIQQPGLFWTHVSAHAILALALLAMAPAIASLTRRENLLLGWMSASLAIFVVASALLNLLAIWTFWHPAYALGAAVKLATAIAAIGSAAALWRLVRSDAAPAPAATPMTSVPTIASGTAELDALGDERDTAVARLKAEVVRREAAEAALLRAQRLEAVGQLTAGIAHDFNNLLQAVAGNLELIARKPDDADRVVRWSASALDAVERGRAVTAQLLAFARKQRVQISAVRLTTLVSGVKGLLERAVAPLGRVEVQAIDPTLNVSTDALQLELAMLNLAFNARDGMPDGGMLTIAAARVSDPEGLTPGDYVALTMTDTGATRSVEAPGLSMAQGVLAQSGGGLRSERLDGQGTRVTLFLPVAAGEPAREVQDDAAGDERIDLSGCTIALVDDDPQVRATLAEMLVAAHATVAQAGSGAEGIALVRGARPDLLVVDFGMPGMSGAEVVRQVRELYRDLPVLLVTGMRESASVDAVKGPGIGILRKPFEAQHLLRGVHALLGR